MIHIDQFKEMIRRLDKADLKTQLGNCQEKAAIDHESACVAELDERYPGWDRPKAVRSGGRDPTYVRFGKTERQTDSQIDAFYFLMNEFAKHSPDKFTIEEWITIFGRIWVRFNKDGCVHIAPQRKLLPKADCALELDNGWWINTNLNKNQKQRLLSVMGRYCGFEDGIDWEWRPGRRRASVCA